MVIANYSRLGWCFPNLPEIEVNKVDLMLSTAKMQKISGIVSAATMLSMVANTALADNTVLNEGCDTVMTIKKWIFGVAYVLGAIGLVVVAISAFLGRFKFAHLIALGGGLFIVAMADGLIKFVTSGSGSPNNCAVAA